MGSSKQTTNYNQNSKGTNQTTFAPMSELERQIQEQYKRLGDAQSSFLYQLINGSQSPYQLNPQDQALLDQSYQSAFDRFNLEGKDYADYLATTRGLNKSDTPVSGQAMQRYGLGMSDLLSQKANAGLNLGLQGTNLRLMGSQVLPSGLQAAFNPMYNERMAGGLTTATGNTTGVQTTKSTPSIMSQIGQGMGLASQALDLGSQASGLFTKLPTKGMGSGAAANSWFM